MAKKRKNKNYKEKESSSNANKRVVVNTSESREEKKSLQPTVSKMGKKKSRNIGTSKSKEMLFGKENFILMGIAALLVLFGLVLMSGGTQAPDEWNTNEIYSSRRIIFAPLLILTGLIINIFAIFKKKKIS